MRTKTSHLLQITIIYGIVGFCGFLTWKYNSTQSEVWRFFLADIAMTIVCFCFSVLKKNSSVYDAYWSVIPFYFTLLLGCVHFRELTVFHYLTFLTVGLWSWRLTLNWVRSWAGFSQEDWRYVNLARQTGDFYPFINFFGIHLFPTVTVFAGIWPLFYMFEGEVPNVWLFCIGIGICLFGTVLEFLADNQLARFRKRPDTKPDDLLKTGVWGISRNPNYLGEILFWLGVFVIGFSFGAPLFTIIGAVVMIGLFMIISIPMKEEQMREKRPAFEKYKKSVPMLIPRFWKR